MFNKYEWNKFRHFYITIIFIVISFVESIYIAISNTPRSGLEYMWLLPFTFGICLLCFNKIILYHKGGIGLKVYYFIAIVRYMITPFLILLTNGVTSQSRMPAPFPTSYFIGIIIECAEIIIACYTISRWYPKYIYKFEKDHNYNNDTEKLNFGGYIAIAIMLIILLARINVWLPELNILMLREGNGEIVILLEATILNCLKALIFVILLSKVSRYTRKNKEFYILFILMIISAIFNFTTYFGSNRSFIVETAIASIFIIIAVFPEYKKRIIVITVPIAIIIITSMFVTKQFGIEEVESFNSTMVSLEDTSNIIEEYTNGPWTIAMSYESSIGLPLNTSFQAFLKDISDSLIVVSEVPGLKWIRILTEEMKSSATIMKQYFQTYDRGQMLSFSGGILIAGGWLFGWILLPLANYFAIRVLTKMEVLSKLTRNVYYKYMYLWMAILMGLTHCYCMQTLIYCWSKFILFYWLILKINNKFKFKFKV